MKDQLEMANTVIRTMVDMTVAGVTPPECMFEVVHGLYADIGMKDTVLTHRVRAYAELITWCAANPKVLPAAQTVVFNWTIDQMERDDFNRLVFEGCKGINTFTAYECAEELFAFIDEEPEDAIREIHIQIEAEME